jgi:hypothetical protein
MEVVETINELGSEAGEPRELTYIESVRIIER